MPLKVPDSLSRLLSLFGPCFSQPGFQTFTVMVVGQLTRVGKHTVTGCLQATGLAGEWHHSRAHRFFSRMRWSPDRLGFVCLSLIVKRLLGEGEELCLAVDDTLVKRYGPKVFGRHRHYDAAAQVPRARRIAWGNAWVVCGAVVKLPLLERHVCLPLLFRLWRPGEGPTQVELAAELVRLVSGAHPDRRLIVLGDGVYGARALAPQGLGEKVTVVVRARRDTRLYRPPPPRRKGQLGRPRLKGEPLDSLREQALARTLRWHPEQIDAYGRSERVELAAQRGIWPRIWRQTRLKAVVVRDPKAPDQIDMLLISSDPALSPKRIVELYARRWSIEVAFRDAKQHGGVGEAQNRTRLAVERTVPFAFLCLSLTVLWYSLAGHEAADVERERRRRPWDRDKRCPSVQDMLVKLRRRLIAARFSDAMGSQASARKLNELAEAWELAVA